MLAMSTAMLAQSGITDFHKDNEVVPMLLSARKERAGAPKDADNKPLTLLHFSDLHGCAENLQRIVDFSQAYKDYIDDVIHTGDGVICYLDDPNEFCKVSGADRILNTVGNHDCWKGHLVWAQTDKPYDATKEDVYNMLFVGDDPSSPLVDKWNVTQPSGVKDKKSPDYFACYYYKDYPHSRIRLIVLDCIHYDEAQNRWFEDCLGDAAGKGLTVIGVTHFPAQNGNTALDSGFAPIGGKLSGVENPNVVQFEAMPDAAFAAVDRFIDKDGVFVCWLSGHTHSDFISTVDGHERQLQIIVDKGGSGDAYMSEDRSVGTINQDAFNLTTVNTTKSLLIINRIGCTTGPDMRSKKLFVYDYKSRKIVTSE